MKKFLAGIMAAMFLCVGIGMVGCGEKEPQRYNLSLKFRVFAYDKDGHKILSDASCVDYILTSEENELNIIIDYDGKDHGVILWRHQMENHPRWPNSWFSNDHLNTTFNHCYESPVKFACYDFKGNFTDSFVEKVCIPGVYVKEERISAHDEPVEGLVCWNERKYTVKVTVY